jgi:hypothetical protein
MNESKNRLHEIVALLIRRTANGELVWSKDVGELYSTDLTKENGRSLKVFIARREVGAQTIFQQFLNAPLPSSNSFLPRVIMTVNNR